MILSHHARPDEAEIIAHSGDMRRHYPGFVQFDGLQGEPANLPARTRDDPRQPALGPVNAAFPGERKLVRCPLDPSIHAVHDWEHEGLVA